MTYLRTGLSKTAALTLSVAVLALPAFAQEEPARRGELTYSQGFEFTDNPNLVTNPTGDSLISRTAVDLALISETRSQSFSFSIGTELVGDLFGEVSDDFDIDNNRAALSYRRDGANSELSFSARYRELDLDDQVFDTGTEFVIDTGSVETLRFETALRTGIEGPFGLDLSASHTDNNYTDTVDPDLMDETTVSVDATAHFRVAPDRAFRAVAGITENDEDGGDETTDTYVGVGIEGETAGGLSYVGDLVFDRSETNGTVTDDGVGVDIGVTQARADGAVTVDLSSRIDEAGRRTSAEVGRSFDLPAGQLAFSLGVVDQEGDDSLHAIGGLDYTRDLPRGALSASLSQNAATSSGDAVISTSLALAYRAEIDANSGWQAQLSYVENDELGSTDDDNRTSASLTYSRALTDEWDMRTGVEFQRINENGAADRSSNTLFFNIERDITFGF